MVSVVAAAFLGHALELLGNPLASFKKFVPTAM
jgi:hypothetical protein